MKLQVIRAGRLTTKLPTKLATALATTLVCGCTSLIDKGQDIGLIQRGTNSHGTSYTLPSAPLVPNASLQLTPSLSISLETMLIGVAAYYFIDPFAPNWQGEMRRLSDDTYSISMRAKRFRSTGGDGESGKVFRRNADEIVRSGGYAGYSIVSYTEGIESELLGAVRVCEGVIQVSRKAP